MFLLTIPFFYLTCNSLAFSDVFSSFSICYTLVDLVSCCGCYRSYHVPPSTCLSPFSACLSVFVMAHCHSITRTPIIPLSLPSFGEKKTDIFWNEHNSTQVHNLQQIVNIILILNIFQSPLCNLSLCLSSHVFVSYVCLF